MPAQIRHANPSDYGRVIQHVNAWWGGREMAPMLPKLFFLHFEGTSFVAEDDDGMLVAFLIGFLSQTDPDKLANRKNHLTEGDQILKELAEDTGGRVFFPYHVDDLDQSFQDIGDELRNQYSIAYNPTNYLQDGRYHKIRIEMPDHKGYQVNARRGYFARANENGAARPAGSAP